MNRDFPNAREEFHKDVTQIVDTSERVLDERLNLLVRNDGVLCSLPSDSVFTRLTMSEAEKVEHIYGRRFHQKIDA